MMLIGAPFGLSLSCIDYPNVSLGCFLNLIPRLCSATVGRSNNTYTEMWTPSWHCLGSCKAGQRPEWRSDCPFGPGFTEGWVGGKLEGKVNRDSWSFARPNKDSGNMTMEYMGIKAR